MKDSPYDPPKARLSGSGTSPTPAEPAAATAIEVLYEARPRQHFLLALWIFSRSPWLMVGSCAVAASLLFGPRPVANGPSLFRLVIAGALAFVVFLLVCLLTAAISTVSRVLSLKRHASTSYIVSIGPDGVREHSVLGAVEFSWAAVRRVARVFNLLAFQVRSGGYIYVPDSAFASAKEAKEFGDTAARWLERDKPSNRHSEAR